MRARLIVAFLGGFCLACLAVAQAGPEFQVNAFTTSYQYGVSVANVGASCNFVVVWASNLEDGDKTAVVGRLFDSAGTPLGGDFVVNVSTTGYQGLPNVASNAAGDFVVTWTNYISSAPPSFEVRARRFNSSGVPQGGEIAVNTYTTGVQARSTVALASSGNFVVVWHSGPDLGSAQIGQDGSGLAVFGQRFDSAGNPLGGEFQLNQYTTGDQGRPRIAMNPAGDFIVVWTSSQDAQGGAIEARRYDAAGNALAGEFQVNTMELGAQYSPDVALDPAGKAIIAWTSYAQDGAGGGVFAQRLDASGNKLGPEFNVNSFTTGFQGRPRVAAGFGTLDPGEFAIIWQGGANQDGDDFGVFIQQYTETGRRRDFEFPVNDYTTAFQGNPAIAAQPNGQFVLAWESFGRDGSSYGISARIGGAPRPDGMLVDVPHNLGETPSGASNLNGVLEVGETVNVEPAYRNFTAVPMDLSGTASGFQGPPGLTYSIPDATASYGTIGSGGGNADCRQATGDCYQFSLSGTRPAGHVDTFYTETLSYNAFERFAILHVGGSFADVPETSLFYPFIENLFHNGVTGGCASGYCPGSNVTRAQMAVFLLKARWGAGFIPAPATGTAFPDVPASNPFARWIEELAREGVTGGCGGGLYCPDSPVTRQQMAVFLLKTLEGSTYAPPACAGDFDDVPCPGQFTNWIEDLAGRSITGGCQSNPPLYCPLNSVLRQQMAAFLVKTFLLQLY